MLSFPPLSVHQRTDFYRRQLAERRTYLPPLTFGAALMFCVFSWWAYAVGGKQLGTTVWALALGVLILVAAALTGKKLRGPLAQRMFAIGVHFAVFATVCAAIAFWPRHPNFSSSGMLLVMLAGPLVITRASDMMFMLPHLVVAFATLYYRFADTTFSNHMLYLLVATAEAWLFAFVLERSNRAKFLAELQLEQEATRDYLTNLSNRRHFTELAEKELPRARRHGRPLSLLLIDLDHFKNVNDRFGHGAGDAVLRETAALLAGGVRQSDRVCRFGGEEFAILLPETEVQAATELAERLRIALQANVFVHAQGRIAISCSIGVSTLNGATTDLDHLVKQADQALYAAKAQGRDCVRVFGMHKQLAPATI